MVNLPSSEALANITRALTDEYTRLGVSRRQLDAYLGDKRELAKRIDGAMIRERFRMLPSRQFSLSRAAGEVLAALAEKLDSWHVRRVGGHALHGVVSEPKRFYVLDLGEERFEVDRVEQRWTVRSHAEVNRTAEVAKGLDALRQREGMRGIRRLVREATPIESRFAPERMQRDPRVYAVFEKLDAMASKSAEKHLATRLRDLGYKGMRVVLGNYRETRRVWEHRAFSRENAKRGPLAQEFFEVRGRLRESFKYEWVYVRGRAGAEKAYGLWADR